MNRRLLLLSLGVVASAAIGCAVQGTPFEKNLVAARQRGDLRVSAVQLWIVGASAGGHLR